MPRPNVSFFTAGERLPHGDSYIIINQCYVQYRPPVYDSRDSIGNLPLLFIHGGGCTGATWETTPDRRPGWAVRASEGGYPIYIVDAVDSGRSQTAPSEVRDGPTEHRTAKEVWERFRFGPAGSFESRRVFEGSQFPIDCFDVVLAAQATRRRTTDEVEMNGIIAAIHEIGECYIIAHSHGAALIMDALGVVSGLIRKLVIVEPGATGVAQNLVGEIPTLLVWGDYLDSHSVWPLIRNPYEEAPVETLNLPDVGLPGNTHFPMLDKNSDEVFQQILRWLERSN